MPTSAERRRSSGCTSKSLNSGLSSLTGARAGQRLELLGRRVRRANGLDGGVVVGGQCPRLPRGSARSHRRSGRRRGPSARPSRTGRAGGGDSPRRAAVRAQIPRRLETARRPIVRELPVPRPRHALEAPLTTSADPDRVRSAADSQAVVDLLGVLATPSSPPSTGSPRTPGSRRRSPAGPRWPAWRPPRSPTTSGCGDRLTELGVDPAEAMAPFVAALDAFHESTRPSTWLEGLVKAYVGDGLAADFYREIAAFLRPATARWCSRCSPTPGTRTSPSARCGRRSRPTRRVPGGWRCGHAGWSARR